MRSFVVRCLVSAAVVVGLRAQDRTHPEPAAKTPAPPGMPRGALHDPPRAKPSERAVAPIPESRTDGRAIGRVLLHLGEERMRHADEASRLGAVEVAESWRASALDALREARRHLRRIEEPRLIDLFRLARCEEKLGRRDVATALFDDIMRRDSVTGEGGGIRYGHWGLAAQVARSNLAWRVDNDGWRPARDVDEIRW
jgi:hypothetical protein